MAREHCAWCGDPTILSTATGPRQRLGVCVACFKNYKPPTGPQVMRVKAVVKAVLSRSGVDPLDNPLVDLIADSLVAAGYYDVSSELLTRKAEDAVAEALQAS